MGKNWYLFLCVCVFHVLPLSVVQLLVICLKGEGWRFSCFFNPHRPPLKSMLPQARPVHRAMNSENLVDILIFFFWPHSTACGISVPRCSSVDNLCSALCDSMDFSTPGFPVLHHLPELTQTQVHWIRATIQPSHPLLLPSPAFNLSQHRGLFQWVSSLHLIAKVSDLQLQDQSFQWIFRVDFL